MTIWRICLLGANQSQSLWVNLLIYNIQTVSQLTCSANQSKAEDWADKVYDDTAFSDLFVFLDIKYISWQVISMYSVARCWGARRSLWQEASEL